MKPLWRMSSREIEELEHRQKLETTPLPSLDTVRKAFEVCFSGGLPQRCIECPYHRNGCTSERERDALDIINSLAERIARLEKPKYIDWELENLPGVHHKPRCDEIIDRQTLIHVICNVDCPQDVDHDTFIKVLNEIAETLDKFPYFKMRSAEDAFGIVQWCDADIESALSDRGIPPTQVNIGAVRSLCESNHHFTDDMVEAGWASIHSAIQDLLHSGELHCEEED